MSAKPGIGEHRPSSARRFLIVTAMLLCAVISPLATASVYFIAPWGTPLGDGTSDHPLDLATMLSSRSSAKPGDTLILLGGTYHGAFVSTLTGAENNPIIVRQAPGARATIDGNLIVQGAWATYWGLEVTNSGRDRKSRPTAVNVLGPHTKFINMIVHGGGNGFGFWTPAVDSEIYGCIIYDNGWQGSDPDRGHGHGIYTQNETGTKSIVDNIIFNGFGWGIHAYTEGGALQGFHLEGNSVFNSGSATRQNHRYDNILVGGLRPAGRIELVANSTYHTPGKGGSNRLGYAAANQDVLVKDNYFAGGSTVLGIQGWEKIVMKGNTFFGLQNLISLAWPKDAPALTHDIDNNTYVAVGASAPFTYRNQSMDFIRWRQAGNIDEYSRLIASPAKRPAGVKIFVRPNRYEPGRAHVTVYNWDLKDTVEADLHQALAVSTPYEVRNVLDYQGDPVATGIYSGALVALPMTGYATGPEFNVLVVEGPRGR